MLFKVNFLLTKIEEFNIMTLIEHFKDLTDPRIERHKRHKLIDIVTITICAVISGAEGWENIEEYAYTKYDWLKQFLELPYGIPSHDTINRLFSRLKPKEFQNAFIKWVKSSSKIVSGEMVSVDGKTLRRSHDKKVGKKAIHIVSAWGSKMNMVLGQIKTDEKSNEITAIPELIDLLDLKGCIVTIDAMGCQKDIAEKIVINGADYVLALKGNQGNLYEDVKLFLDDALDNCDKNLNFYETVDGDHGRIETRRYFATSDIEWLPSRHLWKNLKSIAVVERERTVGEKTTIERSYYISSLKPDAKKIGIAIRSHWGIENKVHWILDVTFRKDDCRKRKGNVAENFAVVRHVALNLLKNEKTLKRSIKGKRLKAGWDNTYLAKVLEINKN